MCIRELSARHRTATKGQHVSGRRHVTKTNKKNRCGLQLHNIKKKRLQQCSKPCVRALLCLASRSPASSRLSRSTSESSPVRSGLVRSVCKVQINKVGLNRRVRAANYQRARAQAPAGWGLQAPRRYRRQGRVVDAVVSVVGQRTLPSPSDEPQRPTCSELLRFVFGFIHKQRPTVITPSFKYQRAPT